MKMPHLPLCRMACPLAIVLLAASSSHAQIGTGWTPITLEKHPDVDGCGSISGNTFRLTCSTTGSAWQRAEYKLGASTSGWRQFEGYLKVVSFSGTNISLKQTFQAPSSSFFMLAIKSGGVLYDHGNSGAGNFMTGVIGQTIRVNTIIGGGSHQFFLNGSLTSTRSASGAFFDKYGAYKTLSGQGPITVEWTGIRSWSRSGSSTPIPTPSPTPTTAPVPTATPTPGGSFVEITPAGSAVTASANDGNLPGNAVDNSLATRWTANGDGAWLELDLGSARTVSRVSVAAYNGNSRQNIFDLQVSTGGGVWTTVWSGRSSGTTTNEEMYDHPDVEARWVRYLGHMSTAGTFNSVTEISVYAPAGGTPAPTPTPVPTATPTPGPSTPIDLTPAGSAVTASTHDGNLPGNTVDDSLATRWSANGDGQWVQYDLGASRTVRYVNLAWYQGDMRSSTFDVLVSESATGPWATALAGKQSSGASLGLETHDFPDAGGRYVRIVGHGNSVNAWNSVTEAQIWGD
jgi:hypothetical protein